MNTNSTYTHITIVYPQTNIGDRTRLTKLCVAANTQGYQIEALNWKRNNHGDHDVDRNILLAKKTALDTSRGWLNKLQTRHIRALYPLYMLSVFFKAFRFNSDTLVYCLGFESAFPVYLAQKFTGGKYIFDDADRFSLILNLPKPLDAVLRRLETIVSRNSAAHVIPGLARYEYRNARQTVVRNTPSYRNKDEISQKATDSNLLTVYLNGWLGKSRGIDTFLPVAQQLLNTQNSLVSFISAGRIDSSIAEEFVMLDNVTYYGLVDSNQAIDLYNKSDIVVTFYDPSIKINRYAESNKWGDAIETLTPILVNSEVQTADFLLENNACFCTDYDDVTGIVKLLHEISKNKSIINDKIQGLEHLRKSSVPFDIRIVQVLSSINK